MCRPCYYATQPEAAAANLRAEMAAQYRNILEHLSSTPVWNPAHESVGNFRLL